MPKCVYHDVCGRDALEDTGEPFCILHSPSARKDTEDFYKALDEHRDEAGDYFREMVFPGYTDCSGVTFTGKTCFTEATFADLADFSSASFIDDADFNHASFSAKAKFGYAKFTNGAFFISATFAERSLFNSATFTGGAYFTRATLCAADFRSAKFPEEADFNNATFTQGTCFNGATFSEGANFSGATFSGYAHFRGVKFMKGASFEGATFTEGADFSGATFQVSADFGSARFYGRTLFASSVTKDKSVQMFSGVEADFSEVIIDPLDALIFRDADLKQCKFEETDLRKAEITGVTWSEIVSKKWPEIIRHRWPQIGKRSGVYDEIATSPEGGTRPWHHIEKVYRELKQNYEDRRDYARASDFHYGEKEMRRKNPKTPLGLWFWITAYWLVSGYGERFWRPLGWAGGLLLVSAIGYLWLGLWSNESKSMLGSSDWMSAVGYSFRVMTFLRPADLVPVDYAKLVHAIESLLGPVFLGLFALALRQQLKR